MTEAVLTIAAHAAGADARRDVHAQQLLEEQFAGVGNLHPRDLHVMHPIISHAQTVVAVLAVVCVVHRGAHQSAVVAHRHHIGVRRVEEPLAHQLRRAIRHQHITLHLTQTQTAVARATLQRLARAVKEPFFQAKDILRCCSCRARARGSCRPPGASGAGRRWVP